MRSLILSFPILRNGIKRFLLGKSTLTLLTLVVHQFAKALEMRQQVDVIYLDFTKVKVNYLFVMFCRYIVLYNCYFICNCTLGDL